MANNDRANIVKHYLKEPIKARYVRINPRAWHGIHICMRFEVFGCQEGNSFALINLLYSERLFFKQIMRFN